MTLTPATIQVENAYRRERLGAAWNRPLTSRLRPALRRGRRPRPGRIALAR